MKFNIDQELFDAAVNKTPIEYKPIYADSWLNFNFRPTISTHQLLTDMFNADNYEFRVKVDRIMTRTYLGKYGVYVCSERSTTKEKFEEIQRAKEKTAGFVKWLSEVVEYKI